MKTAHLKTLYAWFDRYIEPYLDTDQEGIKNIQLKVVHTRKVCEAMELLCKGEELSQEQSRIAAATALLHDVGRFPQYQRWRTFRDSDSDNHARLSIEVIRAERLLSRLTTHEQLLIEEGVRFHNLLEIPKHIQSPSRLFINLVRDADKLDIWRVFDELLKQDPNERASAATLGFADIPNEVSANCVETLSSGSIIRLEDVRILNDFKLLQISWVYDLNCATARRILLERGHIPALASSLPKRDDVGFAIARAIASLSTDSP